MKRRAIVPIVFLLLCAIVIGAVAAGGDASDPLISLSYLNGTYASKVDAAVNSRLDASDQTIKNSVSGGSSSSGGYADQWAEIRLKKSDVLSGSTGLSVMLLAGSAKVTYSSGCVVDVTTGTTVASGSTLTVRHRYLVAEDTTASFTVTSLTAVVDYQGYYSTSLSLEVDYNAMASALKSLNLFQGSATGYGQGFDLEVAPTRLQALIMFIRVLGEDEAALAYNEPTPFKDIYPNTLAYHYVGYAYSKGYTNGYTADSFRPGQQVNAYQYTEFMLRALGYSSAGTGGLGSTLDKAVASGVLTQGEANLLKTSTFLRAHLVYVSYYALEATISGTNTTLRQSLINKGIFTSSAYSAAVAMVPGKRIS